MGGLTQNYWYPGPAMQNLVLLAMFLNIVSGNMAHKSANYLPHFKYIEVLVEKSGLYPYG